MNTKTINSDFIGWEKAVVRENFYAQLALFAVDNSTLLAAKNSTELNIHTNTSFKEEDRIMLNDFLITEYGKALNLFDKGELDASKKAREAKEEVNAFLS